MLLVSDEHTSKPSARPTKQDLDAVVGKIRLRIEDLLWSYGLVPETATEPLREAVLALAQQWSRVRNREQWLLDRIEKAVRRHVNLSPKEPRDDETPPP